jgi:archaemetzincin
MGATNRKEPPMNGEKPQGSRLHGLVGVYACSLPGLCIVPALAWWCMWCSAMGAVSEDRTLPPKFAKLLTMHTKLGKPLPGDWLDKHPEFGQTYRQYVRSRPVRADRQRNIIYVQPLGDFSPAEKKIVDQATEFLGIYFQLPVKSNAALSLDVVPQSARRKPDGPRAEQVLSTYVLDEVLKPRLPKDAVALIAFTNADLWPGEGWNYVFGQASLADRVGVWSIHRYGDPGDGGDAFRLCLLRTLKTASHETGHMFSMPHCTVYECDMCGSNHMAEADRRPLEVCPSCLAKLCFATGADVAKRFAALIRFYKAHGLKAEQEFCEKSLAAMQNR